MGRIYREIRQARRFDTPEEEALVTLLRTADVLRHAVETALRPWRLSPEQYNVLRILRGAPPSGHATLEIARRMISRSPNISRLIDKIIQKGLARRRSAEGDRRVVSITVTPRGLETLRKATAAVERVVTKLSCLNKTRLRSLVQELDAIRCRAKVRTCRNFAKEPT